MNLRRCYPAGENCCGMRPSSAELDFEPQMTATIVGGFEPGEVPTSFQTNLHTAATGQIPPIVFIIP